jgi:hypothetical protein
MRSSWRRIAAASWSVVPAVRLPRFAPEVVLLFKARSKAARDQHDVETALPLLDAGQRSWLHDALKLQPHGKPAAVPHG